MSMTQITRTSEKQKKLDEAREEKLAICRKIIDKMVSTGCTRNEASEEFGWPKGKFSILVTQSEGGRGRIPSWIWKETWAAEGRKNE